MTTAMLFFYTKNICFGQTMWPQPLNFLYNWWQRLSSRDLSLEIFDFVFAAGSRPRPH
jgi:hypothetical protein